MLDFVPDRTGLITALDDLLHRLTPEADPASPPVALPSTLPESGLGPGAALKSLAQAALDGARHLDDAGFFAHMDPPTPWVAWAAAQWSAALNQNLLHPDTAPVAREIESQVVGWLAPIYGMNGGHFVPGTTLGNLTALWVARELRGIREVAATDAAHVSIRKAADLLGLRYRPLRTDRWQRLARSGLGELRRSALVLTCGTVAAGAIDPLDAGMDAAWRHIDAAWAGPLRLSERHSHLLDGIETADSVAVSAHKWLFQPKESALVLFRDAVTSHAAITYGAGYLAVPNVGLLGSHGSSALTLAATLLAWGRQGTAELIDHCMALAERLAERIAQEPELELFAPPRTGVVLWRPRKQIDLDLLIGRLEGAFVSKARIGEKQWLRSVAANPMADPDLVVDRVLAASAELAA